jgi:hypothetical protein
MNENVNCNNPNVTNELNNGSFNGNLLSLERKLKENKKEN